MSGRIISFKILVGKKTLQGIGYHGVDGEVLHATGFECTQSTDLNFYFMDTDKSSRAVALSLPYRTLESWVRCACLHAVA
jgi:hypothetical protein